MVLQTNEYDVSYFDGKTVALRHNAGYNKYERWFRNDGINSLGEFWKDKAKKLFDTYLLNGKKVLELGCAKGFIVEDLRVMGVNCFGLDASSYAIGKASDIVKPFLTIADARTELAKYGDNAFDVVFSLRFLECIPEADLSALINEMNRISKFQFHFIDEFVGAKSGAGLYYLNKSLTNWISYNFSEGTILISEENYNTVLTK